MKKHSFGLTVLLALISALTSLGIDMSLPAMPAIETRFALLPGHGALTLSVFLAGFALTPLFGGPISDRFGRRPVLLVGLLVFTASALGCAMAPGFGLLLVCRLLQGSAAGVCASLPLAIIRDSMEGHAARNAMSQVTTILGVVPVLAPMTGSWVLLMASWRGIYLVQAGLALGLMAAVALAFAETLLPEARQALPVRALAGNYRLVLRERAFLVHGFCYGLVFASMFSYISGSPLVLMKRMHVGAHLYTLIFGLTAGSQMLGAAASGMLSRRRVSGATLIRGGLVLMTVAAAVAAVLARMGFERPVFLTAPTMLVMLAFGAMVPSLTLGALEPIPHVAGSGSGAIRSLQMMLGSAASGFLAWLCARPGIDADLATTVVMLVASSAALILYFTAAQSGSGEAMQPSAALLPVD